jgi:sigma-B regulation protein RsbU (phosphoserine phosphatase)
MEAATRDLLRRQLLDRQRRLRSVSCTDGTTYVKDLLRQVDDALHRLKNGSYGQCNGCNEAVEDDRLLADPLCRVCLDCLSPEQIRSLENDLELAARIQIGLLPELDSVSDGWEVHAHYEPAGAVSGDYYDIIRAGGSDETYFLFGDVSGKGVSASILMANLQAVFRSLVTGHVHLSELMERANRLFCRSTLPTAFATLVCGRAHTSGRIEFVNAGHSPPLLLRSKGLLRIPATGLPLGLFSDARYQTKGVQASRGDLLLLYTDGISEAKNASGDEFGEARVQLLLKERQEQPTKEIIRALLENVVAFCSGSRQRDDITIMAFRRV